ncbi:hypothetical protein BKA64DRAFT_726995 [Cadophora sp. MPI-SDFR-AT-0126]|nr:hypothetical protein BKA64DRAFT_726995 [Leotiomycetes sp. MPI-SDFR-AT-0126]
MARSNDEYKLAGESDSDRALRHEFEKTRRLEADKIRQELLRKHELLRQANLKSDLNRHSHRIPTGDQNSQALILQIGHGKTLNPDRFRGSSILGELAENTGHASPLHPTGSHEYPRTTVEQIKSASETKSPGAFQYPREPAHQVRDTSAYDPRVGPQSPRMTANQVRASNTFNTEKDHQYSRTPARQIGPTPNFTPGHLNPKAGPWCPPPPSGHKSDLQNNVAWSKDPAYIALRKSMGWNQGPPYIDPEWCDEKNHHRFDGDLFIPKGLFDNIPVIATPLAVREAAPRSMVPLARKDSYTGKYEVIYWWCKAHAPASDWKFNKRISFPPRKDVNWRELFHEMTGVPFEVMDDQWVSIQPHWVRASASGEVLRRGWPLNKRLRDRDSNGRERDK